MTVRPDRWLRRNVGLIANRLRRRNRPALNDLDRLLESDLDFDDGFFIEAGANDGYQQSNTYRLEKERGWTGLLIEPVPDLAERCARRRPRSRVERCALVSDTDPRPSVTMLVAGLMSIAEGAQPGSEQEHADRGIEVQRLDESYTIEVPTRTLTSLLDEAPPPSIDFLSLDVEGMEADVLRGLDFSRYRPRYILVEARFFHDVSQVLSSAGYTMHRQLTHHDYLFLRDEDAV